MTTNEIGDDSVWLDPLRDEGWPSTTDPIDHPLLGRRVRITLARKGDAADSADFFAADAPRLKRDITMACTLVRLEVGGTAQIRHDDGALDWVPFVFEIKPAPMRWWHWRRLAWSVAAVVAGAVPVAVGFGAFLMLRSSAWPVGQAVAGAAVAEAPYVWVGALLAAEASRREGALG